MKCTSFQNMVQLYRNNAKMRNAWAKRKFITAYLSRRGLFRTEELDRFKRKEMEKKMKEDTLVKVTEENLIGWEEVLLAVKEGRIGKYESL